MKRPRTDPSKASFPGRLAVKRVGGVPTVFPADGGEVAPEENLLRVVYACGPVLVGSGSSSAAAAGEEEQEGGGKHHQQRHWEDFDALRARVAREWRALPPSADPISASLRAKMVAFHAPHSSSAAAAAAPGDGGGRNGHA